MRLVRRSAFGATVALTVVAVTVVAVALAGVSTLALLVALR